MAEAIAAGVRPANGSCVVHFDGAFHSDFGAGTVERVRRRMPGRRVAVVSMLPVEDLDALTPAGEDLKRADYLVYTWAQLVGATKVAPYGRANVNDRRAER